MREKKRRVECARERTRKKEKNAKEREREKNVCERERKRNVCSREKGREGGKCEIVWVAASTARRTV